MTARNLRILQVMRAPVGGLFRHVADLTRALAANGHAVGLVVDSLANDSQTEARLADILPHASLGLHRVAMPRLLGAGDLVAPLAVRRLQKSLRIDVVHGHGAKGGFYARLASLGRHQPVTVYTPHGGVLHFDKASLSGRIFHMLERQLLAQTGAIVFESAYAQASYAALIGEPTCPTAVIHNGLSADEFVPVVVQDHAADFVSVGELRELKGIHQLVEAIRDVVRPDGTPATLLMVGDGGRRDALEAQIGALGLADRVSLAGAQPARPSFARGRIAVVPSLAESLPYVVLEAAAARLPVIATRVGGIPEIFGPTATSLVPAGDVPALRLALQKALDDPQAAEAEMAIRADYIAQHFTLERMTGAIEALYRQLVDHK